MLNQCVLRTQSFRPTVAARSPICIRKTSAAPRPHVVALATNSTDSERSIDATTTREDPSASGDDDIRATIRRQQVQQQSSAGPFGIITGAIEEAQLITWPKPQKALLDTLLVLFIVAGSGSLLFGCNVALAEFSEVWYHRG